MLSHVIVRDGASKGSWTLAVSVDAARIGTMLAEQPDELALALGTEDRPQERRVAVVVRCIHWSTCIEESAGHFMGSGLGGEMQWRPRARVRQARIGAGLEEFLDAREISFRRCVVKSSAPELVDFLHGYPLRRPTDLCFSCRDPASEPHPKATECDAQTVPRWCKTLRGARSAASTC